jgi:hypothetical protein
MDHTRKVWDYAEELKKIRKKKHRVSENELILQQFLMKTFTKKRDTGSMINLERIQAHD